MKEIKTGRGKKERGKHKYKLKTVEEIRERMTSIVTL
jgi:hypothetical protein